MRIVLRADASATIGSGHVMRCLTLADALRARGAEVLFICRELPGHLCGLVEQRGFALQRLPDAAFNASEDAQATIAAIAAHHGTRGGSEGRRAGDAHSEGERGQPRSATARAGARGVACSADWLVTDHYSIDAGWQRALRPHVARILAIDDLADRELDCDLLLDQNLAPAMESRYATRVPLHCGQMLGPHYALLQAAYAGLHERLPARSGPVQRIFIYFGGADQANLTGRSLSALLSLNRPDINVDVVLSASAPHAPALRALADGQPQVTLHNSLPTLAPLMARADLAIGAGGTSSWERLCLGLPTMVVTLADNQVAITEELQRRGLVQWLGHVDAVEEAAIAAALQPLLAAPIDPAWSQRCRAAVDGRGTARVANILLHGVDDARQVRHATPGDEALLLEWANDRLTRSTAFSPEPIPLATHQAWLERRLRDIDNCRLYIVQTGSGEPMGQVRFERVPGSAGEWEVHYALGPLFRSRQLGLCLLRDALAAHAGEFPGAGVLGRVKEDNKPSRNIFERLDFASQPSDDPAILHFHRVL